MWYRIPAYDALWPLLDAINAELDAKMERQGPAYPGVIGEGQCANCNRLSVDVNRLTNQCQIYEHQAATSQATIDDLRQKLRDQHNEHLRMDRGIYSEGGFRTAGE